MKNFALTLIAVPALSAACIILTCYNQTPRSLDYSEASPFCPTTNLAFDVPSCLPVRIDIYNVQGQFVGTPFDTVACTRTEVDLENQLTRINPATQRTDTLWPGAAALPEGVYFYRLVTPKDTVTKKWMLVH